MAMLHTKIIPVPRHDIVPDQVRVAHEPQVVSATVVQHWEKRQGDLPCRIILLSKLSEY